MVIKGNFTRKAPPPKIIIPKLHNPFISNIAALKRKSHQQEALNILYDLANIVTPIMKEYGFKVKNFVEFFPKTDNLLGMNMNHGFKIFIRLRPSYNDDVFIPMNELIGTMLHELTHNKFGPHDAKFYKLLDELTTKQELIIAKGGPIFESEPFQGQGSKLGGKELNINNIKDARLKRLDIKYKGGIGKVGGDKKDETDLKELVRQAAIKRYEDNKWCHGAVKGDLPQDDELDVIEIDSEDDVEEVEETPQGINDKKRGLDYEDEEKSRKEKKCEKKDKKLEKVVIFDEDEDEELVILPQKSNFESIKSTTEVIDLTDD